MRERVYALPAETVAEVIRIPATARVPQAPKALIGVANLRGVVLPVVSLRALLGLEVEEGAASRAIVLDGGAPVAIVVDAIDALVTIDAERLETQSAQLSVEQGERLSGAFPLGDGQGAAKILDVQALLAETFARRTRPDHPNAASSVIATKAPEAAAEGARPSSASTSRARNLLSISASFRRSSRCPALLRSRRALEEVVAGMMAFREQLLPLLSMRELLGFAPAPVSEMREKIIVASVGGGLVGLIADRARAVIAADPGADRSRAAGDSGAFGGRSSHQIDLSRRGRATARLDPCAGTAFSGGRHETARRSSRCSAAATADRRGGEERKFLVFRLGDGRVRDCRWKRLRKWRARRTGSRGSPRRPSSWRESSICAASSFPWSISDSRFDMPRLEQGDGRRLVVVRTGAPPRGLDRRQCVRSAAYDRRRH